MRTADRRAERGAGRVPEDVRVGQRVPDDALERRAGHREARARRASAVSTRGTRRSQTIVSVAAVQRAPEVEAEQAARG